MKFNLLFIIAVAVSLALPASGQNWVKLMQDPNTNFYDVQKAFNKEWKKKEKEMLKEARKKGAAAEQAEPEGGYMPYKRWEYFMQPRVYPTGNRLNPSIAADNYQQYLQQRSNRRQGNGINQTQGVANWALLGPISNLCDGRVNAITVNPFNTKIVYAGAANGGLWISHNSGNTWTTNTDNLGSLGVSCIVVDPADSNIIYIATGDADHGDSYSIGLLKSTDAGQTWNATGLAYTWPQGKRISKVIVDPSNNQILLVAASSGIYRSTNGGTTWSNAIVSGNFDDLVFNPGDPTVVYAATTTTFYRSTNTGTSFTAVSSGLPAASAIDRLKIGVSAANSAYVYLLASDNSTDGTYGFYQSTDEGQTFTAKNTTTNTLGSQGWYSAAIAVSPTNASEIVVGGLDIYRSTNAGTTWNMVGDDGGSGGTYEHADVHDLKYTPNGDSIYTGNDGGVFVTPETNIGNNWKSLQNGLQIEEAYNAGISGTTNKVIAGLQDNGTDLFNGTAAWSNPVGGDGMIAFIDWSTDNYMYAEFYDGQLVNTSDGGQNWNSIGGALSGTGAWVTPWLDDPNTAATIYAGFTGVNKSTDHGNTWTSISPSWGTIYSLAVAPSNSNYIYASTQSNLYKTTNGGTSWSTITSTLPTGSAIISYIAVSSTDPNSVWVTFSGYAAGDKVYKTSNGGTSWTNVSGSLPNLPADCITYQKGTSNGLYVGMDIGVYYRDDSLADWVLFNQGLPNVTVSSLSIRLASNQLVASTFGRGFWTSGLYSIGHVLPIAAFTSNFNSVCTPQAIQFTDQSTFSPSAWSWNFGDGDTSNLQNPTHTYASNGTYTVTLTASNVNGSNSITSSITIDVPAAPAVVPASRCGDGTLTLGATANGTINWYDSLAGVVPVNAGASYTTPVLSATTTYYVENSIANPPQYAGPVSNTSVGTGNYSNSTAYGNLFFDVYSPITLVSVLVYTNGGAANRTITLIQNTHTLQTITVNLASGANTVTLNWPIPVGSQYELGIQGHTFLYENNAGSTYPYTVNGLLSITGDNSGQSGYYLYFYDWKVQGPPCVSNRVPVTATITFATPTITQTGNLLTASGGTTYQWLFNGNAINGATSQTYLVTATGNYSVVETGNGCTDTSSVHNVVFVGINEASALSGIKIYPNPTKDMFTVSGLPLRGIATVELYNILGMQVLQSETGNQKQELQIDLSGFSDGIYLLKVITDEGMIVRKIVKE